MERNNFAMLPFPCDVVPVAIAVFFRRVALESKKKYLDRFALFIGITCVKMIEKSCKYVDKPTRLIKMFTFPTLIKKSFSEFLILCFVLNAAD